MSIDLPLRTFWIAVGVVALYGLSFAQSQQNNLPRAAAPASTTTLERLATGAGVKTCMNAVRSIGPSLTGPESGYAAALMVNAKSVDASTFSVSIERVDTGVARLVSAFFSPTARGGCDVSYEIIDTWKKSCQDVALQDLKYAQALNVIGRDIQAVPYSPNHHLYMIRVPGGCVTINKEMVFS